MWSVGCQCRAGNFKGRKIPSNARGASRDLQERRNRISGIENLPTNGDRKLGCILTIYNILVIFTYQYFDDILTFVFQKMASIPPKWQVTQGEMMIQPWI